MIANRRTLLAATAGALAFPGAALAAPTLPQPDPRLWDPPAPPLREGFAGGPNGAVYFRLHGKPGATPVIALHGGPAAGHRYMRPYAALATDRQVVLYDQSGSGKSARPADLKRYTLDHYVAELEALRAHLRFETVILLGHSWGGLLAPAYADKHPDRVAGLVLAGTATRWMDFQDAAQIWLAQLGPEAIATVKRAEQSGKTDDPAYGALLQRYYALHLCRLDPTPAWFDAEGEAIGRNPVYNYLNGPSEFQFTGAFAPLDMRAALKRVKVPTLVTCGEFDEGPPAIGRKIATLVRGARLQVFDGLSHMSHIEDPARVIGATGHFIRAIT